jgi:hypothetical protein
MTNAKQVFGTRGMRSNGLQLRDDTLARDRIKHAPMLRPARSSNKSVAVGHRIADALTPSQDKCSLRKILERVDPSAKLIISEP